MHKEQPFRNHGTNIRAEYGGKKITSYQTRMMSLQTSQLNIKTICIAYNLNVECTNAHIYIYTRWRLEYEWPS